MAYHTVASLRALLPVNGKGLTDAQVRSALAVGKELAVVVTKDEFGNEPLSVGAAENFAMAELLKRIFPRDARSVLGREERSDPDVYFQQGQAMLDAFKLKYPERFSGNETSLYITVENAPWLA